ncbi:MAG: tRNA (N6-isopentenyl adenosine(37)-C2)-methylthiotransferase MiaB [Phycisphaerae bacterium]
MKVYLETMGCQMNRLDSELVANALRSAGHEIISDAGSADAVLYNTCSVRLHAEQKVLSRVGADGSRKANGRPVIGVLGCMTQRMGESLLRKCPQVDLLCAPGRLAELPELLATAAAGEQAIALDPTRTQTVDTSAETALDRLDASRDPTATPNPRQAFVRVMRGCDRFCTYCVVPYVRGPERSRRPEDVLEEVRRLADAGRSEITLLGQRVNSYRCERNGREVRLAELIAKTADVRGVRRLRFITSHPSEFTDDILQAMRDLPNVCEYLHVPAQSGSDTVLRRMNRGYTRADYDGLIDRARDIVPDIALAGDFIVGFPGETEQDHAASAELIRRSGYKNCFVFKYSPRPGTVADKRFSDDVPPEVKTGRIKELLAVQEQLGLEHHRRYVGRTVEVLVEGVSPRADRQPTPTEGHVQLTGRTRGDHVVVFDGPETLGGEYVQAEITDADARTLFARLGDRQVL